MLSVDKVKFTDNLKKVTQSLEDMRRQSLEDIGDMVTQEAKKRTAVDTGKAKAGWGFSVDKDTVSIGNKEEHMVYLEHGTRHMKAQPALQPAINALDGDIENLVRNKLKKLK